MTNIIEKELSDRILNLSFTVHNILGPGSLEASLRDRWKNVMKKLSV